MNRLRAIALGVSILGSVFLSEAQAEPNSPPVQFQYMLECLTASTNRMKCAYFENVQLCPSKHRMYKRLISTGGGTSFSEDACDGIGSGGNASGSSHVEYYCDPATQQQICTNWSGLLTVSGWNNTSSPGQDWTDYSTMTNCNEWDNPALLFPCTSDGCTSTNFTGPTSIFISNYCANCETIGCTVNTNYCSTWSLDTLTDEYTTEELLSADGINYPAGDWLIGSPSAPAFSAIGEQETNATMQKMEYRFKVIAPPGAHFDFEYYEHFLAYGSTNEILSTNKITGIGTGSFAYYPTNGPIEIGPPYTNSVADGCTNVIGAQKWITLGCGGAGSSCSSGHCSVTPGSFTVGNQNYGVYVSGSLGQDTFGQGSGALILAGAAPQPNLVTPAGLEFFGTLGGVELLRDQGGSLRQAKSGQLLADIVTNSGTSYTINCYTLNQVGAKDQNGWYTTSGSPLSTATIAQGGSTNEIVVTVVGGITSTYDYTWSSANQGWTLTSGGGLRQETQSWNASALIRTNTIKDSGNHIVYQEVQSFESLASWGNVMIKRVVGPQGPALTSQWFYFDNPQTDGTNYGKIKMAIQPSGAWTAYQYDTNGWPTKEVSQFLNALTNAADNQCRVVTYDYTPVVTNCSCVCRVESLLGQEISRQYTLNYGSEIWTIQCQTPGTTNLNAADNLTTITRNYYDGSFIGKVRSIANPDGTVQLYFYETNATEMTTTVLSGQPDGTGTNIVDGTQTVTLTGPAGELDSRTVVDVASTITIVQDTYTYNDNLNQSYTVWHLDGTYESVQYACCGIDTTTDRDGTVTQYSYDALKRQAASTRNGITTTNVLDAAGNTLATIRIGTDSSPITLRQHAYDTAGGLVSDTNALNGWTSYNQSFDANGQTVKTATYPDGGTRVETYYQDGSLRTLTGTAVFPAGYDYGVESESGVQRAYTKETKLDASGNGTSEWTKTYSDMLGRAYKTLYADSASSQSFYNNQGQLWKQVDPDGVSTLYQYNGKGEQEYTATDMNTNGVIDFPGTDRITRTVSDVIYDGNNSAYVRRTLTYVWTTDNQDASLLLTTAETSIYEPHTWTTQAGLTTETVTSYLGNGQRQTTSYAPDRSYTVTTWQSGQIASVLSYDAYGNPIAQTTYGYDPHGRQNQVTDGRNGTTTNYFNAADQVSGVVTPSPDGVQSPQVTTNFFDTLGRVIAVRLPDNTSVTNKYAATGLLTNTFGSRTYPVAYSFDAQGRMTTMKTWQSFAANQGAATTTWNYNAARGWLDNKRYADGQGPNYTYSPAGRLKTRTWARGLTTTYAYNNAGDLSAASYSDSTPAPSYGYDRRGRQTSATQAGGTAASRSFDDAGNLRSESYSGGPLGGLSVTDGYDQYLRRTNVAVLNSQSAVLAATGFGYDMASRLQTVTDGTNSATYTYLDYSPLVGQVEFASNGVPSMITTKLYDSLNRLTNTTSSTNSVAVNSFAYGYNSANQRTTAALADGTYWAYTYDNLGQVVSGKKYWADGTLVAGQQFVYGFDDIGNRQTAASGGDSWGAELRCQTYSANSLNQYVQRTVPGYAAVLGTATSNATVTLWTASGSYAPALRKGDYFRAELPVNNSTGAVWLTLTNLAVLNDGSNPDIVASTVGQAFLPRTPEAPGYDADGNLIQDGRWTYSWDAENRLTNMTSLSTAPTGSKFKLDFVYDPQGRRIQKIVSTNNGSAYYPQSTNRFVYDGWNLMAVLNPQSAVVRSFMWGLDLSGSPQGAGGVGGLLEVNDAANGVNFAAFDGNGNVVGLVKGADGTVSAQYEYGPFGEVIRATGPMAKASPFRFSTKYQDDETDLVYYGYRYYNACMGRWLSRDPLEEDEAANLYSLLKNKPLDSVDPDGRCELGNCGSVLEASASPRPRRTQPPGWCNPFVPAYWPTDEHDPCCEPPAKVEAYAIDNGSKDPIFKMKIVFTKKENAHQLQINWTTCSRPVAFGVLPSCNNKEACDFNAAGMGVDGSWMIGIWINWLSCENGSYERRGPIHLGLNCHTLWRPGWRKWICN
ncbi:MAG: RHS repeat domain-containing protein [Limisphaerales bacterium]